MRRQPRSAFVLAAVTAALLLAATPALAASPFGMFNGIVQRPNATSLLGVERLVGWALDDDGVQRVEIYVDGRLVGQATYGGERPQITATHPGFPDTAAPGWGFRLDTTRFVNGLHTVSALVVSESGERAFLNSRTYQFVNTTHLLVPFGNIEFPPEDAELYGTCDLDASPRRLSPLTGWTLDVGVETNDLGVGYVELLLDGSILYNSVTDCFYLPAFGGWTNCFGLRRLDIERAFPLVRDAPHPGFRFVADVGALINFGWLEGRHVFTVRVGDIAGQVSEIDAIPVTFRCDDLLGNEASFGALDLPSEGLVFSGTVTITGYAVDFEGVNRVEIYVDGVYQGNATYGLARPSVGAAFPGYPDAANSGWSFSLDSTLFSESFHQVQVVVVDDEGESTHVGERQFKVTNP
jgi:N-acetylmuramoyl-L-alanine amidase